MWTRSELKSRSKATLSTNYWLCVLAGLILYIVGDMFDKGINFKLKFSVKNPKSMMGIGSFNYYKTILENLHAGTFWFIFVVVFIVCFTIRIFLLNPLTVGGKRFFMINLHEPARIGNIGFGFERNYYKNIVGVMASRTIYTIFWSLLFIIPGIIKAYEYMMIPYLLAENPNLTEKEAFETSRQMMDGQKWKAFVLDLSFLGWYILSGITQGLLGIFYVNPYANGTHAALFEALRFGNHHHHHNNNNNNNNNW